MEQAKDRLAVLERIKEYERLQKFNDDVEEDPPSRTIKPNEVDYLNKKLSSKFLKVLANKLGTMFFESMIKKKKFIIKSVSGLENVSPIKEGAIVTCNHFNIKDNYVVYKALKPTFRRKQRLNIVIKEGNYTSFKGVVRLLMRHGNTLPLSSSFKTMKKFYSGIEVLLSRGEKILVYPEQAMWWNYRKPRPFKIGAFKIAAKNSAPIIPVFITMKDTDILDDDGFLVQEYYVHILPAIYPEKNLSENDNAKMMMDKNYKLWVDTYEDFYKEKLELYEPISKAVNQ